jgi:hypothetical protein
LSTALPSPTAAPAAALQLPALTADETAASSLLMF